MQDYPHLILWKELGFDKLPVISFEEWVALYQEKAVKRFWGTSVFHIGLDGEGRETWHTFEKDLRDDVAYELYGKLLDKVDDVCRSKGKQLIDAQKAARLKGNKEARNLELSPPSGGGIEFSNNELWALKQCYLEIQACIKEVRRLNDIPLKKTPDFEWNKSQGLDLAAPVSLSWLGRLFDSSELPLFVSYPRVTDCAMEILHERLPILRYWISKRRLQDKLKKFQIN